MWLPTGGQIGNGHIRVSSLAQGERCKQSKQASIAAKQSICTNSACVLCFLKQTMNHSEEIHVERLASKRRICAKKSKAKSKEAKPVACVSF